MPDVVSFSFQHFADAVNLPRDIIGYFIMIIYTIFCGLCRRRLGKQASPTRILPPLRHFQMPTAPPPPHLRLRVDGLKRALPLTLPYLRWRQARHLQPRHALRWRYDGARACRLSEHFPDMTAPRFQPDAKAAARERRRQHITHITIFMNKPS